MLSLLLRRITLTGLLLTAFIGTGLLFGTSQRATATDRLAVGIEFSLEFPKNADKIAENIDTSANNGRVRKGPDLDWPFFSFSRKGGR